MKNRLLTTAIAACIALGIAHAQEAKLTVRPIGRILMDGGLFDAKHENNLLNDGFAISDARVGVSAKYGEWAAVVDMGFAYNKVGIKDIYVKRQLGLNNWVQAGYFVHHFGLQSATSTSFKISMEEPLCESAFDSDRLLGLMYAHSKGRFLGTFSFFSETEAMKLTSEN